MDFYATCAHYWGVTRWEAKTRIIEWFYLGTSRVEPYIQVNHETLNFIPTEARAEVLEFQGIMLGDD